MISLYKTYLTNLLKESGCKRIYSTIKEMETSQAPNMGGILFQTEELKRVNTKKTFEEDGTRKIRLKKYERITSISIIIGETNYEKCENIYEQFLMNLDNSINDGKGNSIKIDIGDSDWVEDKDSILRAKIAVQIDVTFESGIYKDYTNKPVNPNIGLG
ncbi:SON protein [Vallitalea guaymasensis]|uniref:SON protein n=1 Tax=Vallitalea guaymasensis TaxID=1185412 RepID=UPI000DE50D56|nr:SON protein [Vallitalea guaymasensis]